MIPRHDSRRSTWFEQRGVPASRGADEHRRAVPDVRVLVPQAPLRQKTHNDRLDLRIRAGSKPHQRAQRRHPDGRDLQQKPVVDMADVVQRRREGRPFAPDYLQDVARDIDMLAVLDKLAEHVQRKGDRGADVLDNPVDGRHDRAFVACRALLSQPAAQERKKERRLVGKLDGQRADRQDDVRAEGVWHVGQRPLDLSNQAVDARLVPNLG